MHNIMNSISVHIIMQYIAEGQGSEGGMMRLETRVELKFVDSSCSRCFC